MKTLIITAALVLTSLVTFGQSKTKIVKIVKEFPRYYILGNNAFASEQQVKATDSLKKLGYVPTGVIYVNDRGTMKVTFIKAIKQ